MASSEIVFGDTNQEEFERLEHRRLQNRLAQRKRRRSQHPLHGRKQGQLSVTTTLSHDPQINRPKTIFDETQMNLQAFGSESKDNGFEHILVQHNCTDTSGTLVARGSETYIPLNPNIPAPFPAEKPTLLDNQQVGSLSLTPLGSSQKQLPREMLLFNISDQNQSNIEPWHMPETSNYHDSSVFQDPGFDDDIFKIMLAHNGNSEEGPDAQMVQSTTNPKLPSAVPELPLRGLKLRNLTAHTSVNSYQAPTKGKTHTRSHSEGKTTLHLAAANGHANIVKCLLDFEVGIEARDASGTTPLHQAAKNGHTETVSVLLQRGANVETTDVEGWTALHMAASNGHGEVVRLLIQGGVNLNARIEKRRSLT